jgi:hypothetical protein
MEYAFFVLYNNEDIFNANAAKYFKDIDAQKVSIYSDSNLNNKFTSIRSWINEKLEFIYSHEILFKNSVVFFMHQDVIPSKSFLVEFQILTSLIDLINTGVIGFAGIDSRGCGHSLMVDSGLFCFTGDIYPVEVESVDEMCFAIQANVLILNKVKLSEISGWHAYAVEFSIILNPKGFKTYYFPIFIEHNSIRTNNFGLLKCHRELYDKYKVSIKTLIGDVRRLNSFQLLKRNLREIYINYLKFKINPDLSNSLKSILLDKTGIYPNKSRILNSLISEGNCILCSFDNNPVKMPDLEFNLRRKTILFKRCNYADLNDIISSVQGVQRVFLLGLTCKVDGFIYNRSLKLNYRI